ncbi:hypothetical protein M8J77_012314 [Diaphorina citri]|nr:hypothetical protein M8J77_012314 [Diaphorina citri]
MDSEIFKDPISPVTLFPKTYESSSVLQSPLTETTSKPKNQVRKKKDTGRNRERRTKTFTSLSEQERQTERYHKHVEQVGNLPSVG